MRLFVSALLGLLAVLWSNPAFGNWPLPGSHEREVRTHRALRYERVVGQTSWVTCGPAAVATLLTHFLGIHQSEQDVLRAIARGEMGGEIPAEFDAPLRLEGYSMLDLKRALAAYGVESAGYGLSEEVLKEYFDQGGLPVIVHLAKPRAHFAVLVGYVGDQVILGDPSFGERTISRSDLVERYGFSGNVLVLVPEAEQYLAAHERQVAVVRGAFDRQVRLRRMGAAL